MMYCPFVPPFFLQYLRYAENLISSRLSELTTYEVTLMGILDIILHEADNDVSIITTVSFKYNHTVMMSRTQEAHSFVHWS